MIYCFNDVHRLVNKMIVLLSEDLLIEFLLCHEDVPSLQHLSFCSSKMFCKVNYVYVYALLYCTYAIYIYIYYKCKHILYMYLSRWGAVEFVDFTKVSFALSSLPQPFNRVRSIQEQFFVILSQRKACAGRFREETAGKRTGPITRWPPPVASVHPIRNSLCYHFSLYQRNEICSQRFSRRLMLLISFNKSCLRVTAQNVTEAERPFYERSQR